MTTRVLHSPFLYPALCGLVNPPKARGCPTSEGCRRERGWSGRLTSGPPGVWLRNDVRTGEVDPLPSIHEMRVEGHLPGIIQAKSMEESQVGDRGPRQSIPYGVDLVLGRVRSLEEADPFRIQDRHKGNDTVIIESGPPE